MKFRKLRGWKYQITEPVVVQLAPNDLPPVNHAFVKIGDGFMYLAAYYAWDGASGPCPDFSCIMLPSLAHDALYQMMRLGLVDRKYRKFADHELKRLCLERGMARVWANLVYWGVRLFAGRGVKPRPESPVYEVR